VGATIWRYYTPYQHLPEAAFQALRAEVFARGEYAGPAESIDDLLLPTVRRLGGQPASPAQLRQMEKELQVHRAVETGDMSGLSPAIRAFAMQIRGLRQAAGKRGARRGRLRPTRPRSIPELLQRAGESGTHSILDIERVSGQPEFGVAVPLPPDSLRRAFGTDMPTHEEVEEHWPDVAERLGRWQACYLVVYRDAEPHEYAFIGCSGD
jgi:hypothetical protein